MANLQRACPAEVSEPQHLLTDQQEIRHKEFKAFVSLNVEPFAERWDREQRIPDSVISQLAKSGYLGCSSAA